MEEPTCGGSKTVGKERNGRKKEKKRREKGRGRKREREKQMRWRDVV
jgi:hypothetical protein